MEETWAGRDGGLQDGQGVQGGSWGSWAKPPHPRWASLLRPQEPEPCSGKRGGIEADAPMLISEVLSCSRP